MGMMDGSSLRMMVGTYSAFGTFEEISWRSRRRTLEENLSVGRRGRTGSSLGVSP